MRPKVESRLPKGCYRRACMQNLLSFAFSDKKKERTMNDKYVLEKFNANEMKAKLSIRPTAALVVVMYAKINCVLLALVQPEQL